MTDPRAQRSPLTIVAVLVSLAVYGALAAHFAWLCDDAFISFRYAEHWAEGRGLPVQTGLVHTG